jgi:hypothetical protein
VSTHFGNISTVQPGVGAAISLQGTRFHGDDKLRLRTPHGNEISARVNAFKSETLEIVLGKLVLKCRPWATGDTARPRLFGTLTNWTVEAIRSLEKV